MPYFPLYRNWVELCRSLVKFSTQRTNIYRITSVPICSLALVTRLAKFFHIIYHSTPIKPLRYFGKRLFSSKVTATKFSAMTSLKNIFVCPSRSQPITSSVSSRYPSIFRSPESIHLVSYLDPYSRRCGWITSPLHGKRVW